MASSSAAGTSTSVVVAEEVTGSHVHTINGYSCIKGLVWNEFYCSSTFTAAGHCWSILYYPNGHNNANESGWVSIHLRLDQTFSTNVKARFKISLIDWAGKPSYSQTSLWTHTFTPGVQKGFPRFAWKISVERLAKDHWSDSVKIRCDITVVKETKKEDAPARLIVVPPPDMQCHLGELLSSGEGADVKLEVDGETFPAHRNILAARSPVFKAQLFGPMKENTEACMWIQGIEARVFKAFLHFIYTDSLPEIEDRDVMVMAQHLLVAADRYGVERLKLICEDKLCSYIDTSSVGTVLALAEQHGCDGLKMACLKFLMSGGNLKAALETDGFDHLSKSCPSILKELLAKVAP